MPLTSEIKRRDSWVNRFFKERFPGVVSFAQREGLAVRNLKMLVHPESQDDADLVGTAFDYRLRMHF